MKTFFTKLSLDNRASVKQRIGAGFSALCALLAMATTDAFAISLMPGREISPTGTAVNSRPELAGTVLADTMRPFSIDVIPKGSATPVGSVRRLSARPRGTFQRDWHAHLKPTGSARCHVQPRTVPRRMGA